MLFPYDSSVAFQTGSVTALSGICYGRFLVLAKARGRIVTLATCEDGRCCSAADFFNDGIIPSKPVHSEWGRELVLSK